MVGVVRKAVAVAAAMAQCGWKQQRRRWQQSVGGGGWGDRVEVAVLVNSPSAHRGGATAIYLVASGGHPEAVALLVGVGADT